MSPPTTDTNSSLRRLHGDRARRWGCSAFVAEWFANAVEYCQSGEGRAAFEKWAIKTHGPEGGRDLITICRDGVPAHKTRATGSRKMINAAAVDLRVPNEAMEAYHAFTANNNLCSPPRTLPAPRRRRGESSVEWLARRHKALLEGAKLPDIDLAELRRTAIAQYDATAAIMEVWRTDLIIWLQGLMERTESTIRSHELRNLDEEQQRLHTMCHAFMTRLHGVNMAHASWYRAVGLFEDLDRMGLKTPAAIERAYKRDSKLLWQLVGVACACTLHWQLLCAKTIQVVSYCEYFRPFFKRYRDASSLSHIEPNEDYIKTHPFKVGTLDELVVRMLGAKGQWNVSTFCDNMLDILSKNPEEGKKFSAQAYDELGDLAIVNEFRCLLTESAFGQALCAASLAAYKVGDTKYFFSEISFMKASAITMEPMSSRLQWGHAQNLYESCSQTWSATIWETVDPHIWEATHRLMMSVIAGNPFYFDELWRKTDELVWADAEDMDFGDGVMMATLGLWDPSELNRPTLFGNMWEDHQRNSDNAAQNRSEPPLAEKSTYKSAIPEARPTDTTAKSGHAYRTETKEDLPKERTKTRGNPDTSTQQDSAPGSKGLQDAAPADGEAEEDLPEFLPTEFSLPRKFAKVFHRIFDPTPGDGAAGMKKGQVRWDDFEKAMRRVGFGIVQTAGSSVRFDPPAKGARPIAFHRPHPDALLTPHLLKIVGARLKRCYGWTMSTFQRSTTGDTDD